MLGRCTTGPDHRKASIFAQTIRRTRRKTLNKRAAPRCASHSDRDKKEAGSALPFTPRPAGVAYLRTRCRSLGRRREHSGPRALCHFVHQAARFPKTTKREVQSRFPELLVPKPAIQPVARHEAHLVVQRRPSGAAPFEAERDEVDRHLSDSLVRQPLDLPRATTCASSTAHGAFTRSVVH